MGFGWWSRDNSHRLLRRPRNPPEAAVLGESMKEIDLVISCAAFGCFDFYRGERGNFLPYHVSGDRDWSPADEVGAAGLTYAVANEIPVFVFKCALIISPDAAPKF